MEDIVISGISGRFPQSDNVEEFTKNLLNNVNMLTNLVVQGHTQKIKCGKMKDPSRFDAKFFGVHTKLADVMEPQLRTLLEVTYEAIVDAGMNPGHLRGTSTGVFVGVSSSESAEFWNNNKDLASHYAIIGNALSMLSNRISYSFDFIGPSITLDTACSASGEALHQAVTAMRNGDCESAIVAGTNLTLNKYSFLKLGQMKLTSAAGACQTFDASADGYVRSEANIAVFLQKRSSAFRLYSTVLATATNCDGYKEEGITYPKGRLQRLVTEKAYGQAGVNPRDVTYVEAHGSGTKAGDFEETNWIADYFCKDRNEPLPIGSTKSNMGHAEAASGLASLAKIIIAMETGIIPANLHYRSPNPAIPGLADGRLKVVDKNESWKGGIVGLNNFGFGGVNVHAVLKSNNKEKREPIKDGIPRLLCVSGRTESAVDNFLSKLEKMPRDDDLMGLIHKLHQKSITNHPYRGYTILEGQQPMREISEDSKVEKVWYVFTGMGCQWIGMGQALLEFNPFRESMERCARALALEGFQLFDMLNTNDETNFDLMANCAPCITAIQVALVDILALLGIKPDGIIGHSMGEIACAYADGSLTAEQAVLASYWRGRCVDEDQSCPGSMAAVGLSWKEAEELCAGTNVSPVCHNAANSVTISGPVADVDSLMKKLESEGKFVRKVQSSNQALHTKYISKAGQKLLPILKKIIPLPKLRSKAWLSSSIPQVEWTSESAQYASAEYITNNLLRPVLFHEVATMIPEKTAIIEIGPHALFQTLLRKMVPKSCSNIGLAKKGVSDGLGFILSSLGKIYMAGVDVDIAKLYPPISFPVSRGTPMISPMVEWDHSIEWTVPNFDEASNETIIEINPSDESHRYILGHRIDGRTLFPGCGYITLAWKALAKLKNKSFEELPVCFENVNFLRPTIVSNKPVKFLIRIREESDSFEVINNQAVVANGQYRLIDSTVNETVPNLPVPSPVPEKKMACLNSYKALPLTKSDIYKELRLRGYEYQNEFQSLKESDNFGLNGVIEWSGNWITFMDSILQMLILNDDMRQLYVPVSLLRIVIDPKGHLESFGQKSEIPVQLYPNIIVGRAGGVEIRKVRTSIVVRRLNQNAPKLTYQAFVPFTNTQEMSRLDALTVLTQLVRTNCGLPARLKAVEIADKEVVECLLSPDLVSIYEKEAGSVLQMTVVGLDVAPLSTVLEERGIELVNNVNVHEAPIDKSASKHLICGRGLLKCLENIAPTLVKRGFVFTREDELLQDEEIKGFTVVASLKFEGNQYILLRLSEPVVEPEIIKITSKEFSWIEPIKQRLSESSETPRRVILTNDLDPTSGLLGLFNCLQREPGGQIFDCVFNKDNESIDLSRHGGHLKKNLKMSVMCNGEWGAMFHLPLPSDVSTRDVNYAYVNTLTRGDLTSLRWIESPKNSLKANHEQCTVYFAPLNFKDVMLATGKLPPDALPGNQPELECIMGLEFAGRDSLGRRVMGMMEAQAMATSVTVPSDLLWPVPNHWTLQQASSVPIVYSTCIYALVIRGKMKKGESVLIHTGSGGVGLAAIHLALHAGLEVFTTVGTAAKREFLLETFPELKPENIGNSRDTSFEQMVMDRTDGRGVDIVLNSLADDKLQASIRCLAEKGRFLEIGKFDLIRNSNLGMVHFLKNITFHGILLDNIFDESLYSHEKAQIVELMNEGIRTGAIKPLPVTTFESSTQLEEAFRYMATGKHIGKVVLKLKQEEGEHIVRNTTPASVSAVVKTYFDPNKSYIITGGLGGLGIELCNWILKRGGRHIVLTTTSGVTKGYQALMLRRWAEKGHNNVSVYKTNCGTTVVVTKLLEMTQKKAPVGGIFCLSGVIRDALMVNQTEKNFEETLQSKNLPTSLLDELSRKYCPKLDSFVVFSSVSSGHGNPGQANYALANAAMERICELRQKSGYPATAIQWGPISDVGMVANHEILSNDTVLDGIAVQKINSFFETLDILLQDKRPVVASLVVAPKKSSGVSSGNDPAEIVANILGIKNYKTIAPSTSLIDLGMDSLMGAEIKQTLEREFDVLLDVKGIKDLTFGTILELRANILADKSANNQNQLEFIGNENIRFLKANIMPTETLVKMTEHSIDGRQPIFIVHPIEGTVDTLTAVAKLLEGKDLIYGLQCTKHAPLESIKSLASFYLREIQKIQPAGPYRLVGCSFGGYVAYEITQILESQNESIKLILLGHLGVETSDFDDALTRFTSAFTRINLKESDLQNAAESTKINHCAKKLAQATDNSETDWIDAIDSYWKKTKALANYEPSPVDIRSPCLLIETYNADNALCALLKNIDKKTLTGEQRNVLEGDNAVQVSQLISEF